MKPAMKKKGFDKAIWYKSMDPAEKEKFCSNQQSGRNHLVLQKNNLLSNRAIWQKSLDTAQKQKRAENGLTCLILHKNKKEQNGISH